MMISLLRPVGERIENASFSQNHGVSLEDSSRYQYFGSGSQALAVALKLVAQFRHNRDSRAKVALPAYGCPDIVSAIRFVGAEPIFIDLEFGTPWLDLSQLENHLDRNLLAVIGVNFLGIPERTTQLVEMTSQAGIPFIYDCCQWYPRASETPIVGDMQVFSFGRGKPLSILSGGELRIGHEGSLSYETFNQEIEFGYLSILKTWAYNFSIRGQPYFWFHLLGLTGKTVYKDLCKIEKLSQYSQRRLQVNLHLFQNRECRIASKLSAKLCSVESNDIVDLPRQAKDINFSELLRYPVLLPSKQRRDRVIRRLLRSGISGSSMYRSILPKIKGVLSNHQQEEWPAAENFADRLLTLPIHSEVTISHVERMIEVLKCTD